MSEQITINIKGPSELKLTIAIEQDKTVKELKEVIAEKSEVPSDRQRLIYSGKVLKDEDPLSAYKIQSNHTIHMVKGAARTAEPAAGRSQPLPNMSAGQNPADPLTMLNTPMAHGALAGFNPFADMGLNPNDPNMMQGMMDNPQFLNQLSQIMSNPQMMETMMRADPNLREMAPHMQQYMQSEQFRQMMSNPETLRGMLQMANLMRSSGLPMPGMGLMGQGARGGAGGGSAFASLFANAPVPAGTAQSPGTPTTGNTSETPASANPTSPGSNTTPGGFGAPFGAIDPALIEQLLGGEGGLGGLGPFGGPFGAPAPATDGPPPEERFQVQLQQLSDMGFSNAQQNVRALLATGGNVHSAIEYILGGGGLN